MKKELIEFLRCPISKQKLILQVGIEIDSNIESGWLVSEDTRFKYPITSGIPRFVDHLNYANNFGMQWNKFRKTQLDSFSGHPISADRFWSSTKWSKDSLRGKWVLDAGCGAGRFAEIALRAGAKVIAIDYSSACDACYLNLRDYENFHVVQADIYSLPFKEGLFPFV